MKRGLAKNERGVSLIEVSISIGLMGILLAGFIPAMMGATRSMINTDERETAKNLAESQMEYLKGQPYESAYDPYDSSAAYPGFTVDDPVIVSSNLTGRDSDIQSITVVVRRDGGVADILTGYKMR